MRNRPRFSIVTCTWNSAATLAETLDSVRRQRCQDLEHVFVDGGSSDATLAMLEAYPGPKRILRDVGGGISRAMNAGIRAASGEIVAHLHADDYYAGDAVLADVDACFAATGADWVVGNIQTLRNGALLAPYPQVPFSFAAFAAGRASVPHPAVFIRKALFARAGLFDETLRYAMDIDLWLRLGALARPAMLPQTLAVFRDHAGSVSSANKLSARREEFQVRRRYLRKAPLAFGLYCLRYWRRMRLLKRHQV
jgi:glycosyltransferase involved in cell wall biosynthesis